MFSFDEFQTHERTRMKEWEFTYVGWQKELLTCVGSVWVCSREARYTQVASKLTTTTDDGVLDTDSELR